jgi:hypothetical protein
VGGVYQFVETKLYAKWGNWWLIELKM